MVLPGLFNTAYAGGDATNWLFIGVLVSRTLAFFFALVVPALVPGQSYAKDTGLIFVSNEKTNNLIVIDPKTYQVVKDIKGSRRPRDMHFNAHHTKSRAASRPGAVR